MASQNQPFHQLENALENLFQAFDELQNSLENLSNLYVVNTPQDARSEAMQIQIFSDNTRYKLVFYLETLQKLSTAMIEMKFGACESEAIMARYTMNEEMNQMLKALEHVVELLKRVEENKQERDDDIKNAIEKTTPSSNSTIKGAIVGLLNYIKEELKKAVDDRGFLVDPSQLKEDLDKVKQAITQANKSYGENISALDNVMSTINELSGKEDSEHVVLSLKANAGNLKEACKEKLQKMSTIQG